MLLSIDFRLVIKCKCLFGLFVCLVGLAQQNMIGLGSIDRKKKCQFHWVMES